jgi:hypothetical protein
MRNLCTFIGLIIASATSAQIINGTFEDNGVFNLAGWEWTCAQPGPVHQVPIGGGVWSASKNMSNDVCGPSYIFQRIPFAQNGEVWHLSAWVRSDSTGIPALPRISLSSMHNGIFSFQSAIGSAGYNWEHVSINDTVHASATDTAVVLLNPGDVNGPLVGAGWFDGVEFTLLISTGIHEGSIVLHTFIDQDQVLHIAADDRVIRDAQLFDPTGRALPTHTHITGTGSVAIGVDALPNGVYIVQVITDAGPVAARFVKQ